MQWSMARHPFWQVRKYYASLKKFVNTTRNTVTTCIMSPRLARFFSRGLWNPFIASVATLWYAGFSPFEKLSSLSNTALGYYIILWTNPFVSAPPIPQVGDPSLESLYGIPHSLQHTMLNSKVLRHHLVDAPSANPLKPSTEPMTDPNGNRQHLKSPLPYITTAFTWKHQLSTWGGGSWISKPRGLIIAAPCTLPFLNVLLPCWIPGDAALWICYRFFP